MTISRLEEIEKKDTRHQIITGDTRKVMASIPEGSIDLIVTSPPYFDVVDYKHDDGDQLGNIHDYEEFLIAMKEAFQEMMRVLGGGRHAVVNTQDLFKKAAKCPIHSDYIQIMRELGFEISNVNIYILNYSTGGRLVYGYPVSYYPKNDHEYIIVARKP
jgi:site-specific DNA-methyltransferase (adenine-specific)